MKRIGFTLIELLVAVGILAVMLAIFLPVFSQIREKGRQTVCVSNERQLGVAFLLYAQENDGVMAANTINPDVIHSSPAVFWPQLISPYVHDAACFICPDSAAVNDSLYKWPGGRPGPPRVSYIYNHGIGGLLRAIKTPLPEALVPKTLGQVVRPAATVLLTDGATDPVSDLPETWPEAGSEKGKDFLNLGNASEVQGGPGVIGAAPNARHGGKANVLFADGHVQSLRLDAFYVLPGERGFGEKELGISPCLDSSLGCPSP